jgi:hypothetical protein
MKKPTTGEVVLIHVETLRQYAQPVMVPVEQRMEAVAA